MRAGLEPIASILNELGYSVDADVVTALVQNDLSVQEVATPADFTEANFEGYSRRQTSFFPPIVDEAGNRMAPSSPVVFAPAAECRHQRIWGWALIVTDSGVESVIAYGSVADGQWASMSGGPPLEFSVVVNRVADLE